MVSSETQFRGYRLTTVEITYRRPDFLDLLQIFVLQQLDLPPKFPRLKKLLRFWEEEIDGPLHSVLVDHVEIITPPRLSVVKYSFSLH